MTRIRLITLYISFCILAMFCNLFVQRIFLYSQHSSSDIIIAIAMGTIAGLIVKYFLDKNWIFNNYEKSIFKNMKYFMKYSFFGIATTLIFWSFELSFLYIWKSELAREIGAIIGLSIGYYIKYKLDKKYVFTNS